MTSGGSDKGREPVRWTRGAGKGGDPHSGGGKDYTIVCGAREEKWSHKSKGFEKGFAQAGGEEKTSERGRLPRSWLRLTGNWKSAADTEGKKKNFHSEKKKSTEVKKKLSWRGVFLRP